MLYSLLKFYGVLPRPPAPKRRFKSFTFPRSMSFVLVTSAICLVLLSVCYVFTDAWRLWGGGPFRAPGLNAIALYIGHSVCSNMFPFHWKVPNMETHALKLLEALWGTALWVIIAHVMAKKKVFITL